MFDAATETLWATSNTAAPYSGAKTDAQAESALIALDAESGGVRHVIRAPQGGMIGFTRFALATWDIKGVHTTGART